MDDVENIKSKIDIVEVVSSYLPLKKTGRNFAGLCPFHSEKTPSFMVSAERQAFKCFGCSESGDVFTFLEKIEGWDFRETLEELAKRAGVNLAVYKPSAKSQAREKILEINKLTAQFYSYLLNKHAIGVKAREYLKNRGIKNATWQEFNVGYAPGGWDKTLNFLVKRKFPLAEIAESGMIVAKSNQSKDQRSYYDRFRDRLIFPLKDSRGVVTGFSARVIDEEVKDQPKYINSPETPVYNKGSLLYGLDLAKSEILKKNELILVEGEFDVLRLFQTGVKNVVATKGTALTDKQVAQIGRLVENVTLCFDTDVAGDAASRRGIELLDLAGVNIKLVTSSKYKDPDEFARENPVAFKKALSEAINIYDYLINSSAKRFDAQTVEGKKKIGKEILPTIAKISDDLVKAVYIEKLAKVLNLETSLVADAVNKRQSIDVFLKPQDSSGDSQTSKQDSGLEYYFLALFIFRDELEKGLLSLLAPDDFVNAESRAFWNFLRAIMKDFKTPSFSKIKAKVPKDLTKFLDSLYFIEVAQDFSDKELWAAEIVKIAHRIKMQSFKMKLSEISDAIKLAQREDNEKKVIKLSKKFDELSKNLKKW